MHGIVSIAGDHMDLAFRKELVGRRMRPFAKATRDRERRNLNQTSEFYPLIEPVHLLLKNRITLGMSHDWNQVNSQ